MPSRTFRSPDESYGQVAIEYKDPHTQEVKLWGIWWSVGLLGIGGGAPIEVVPAGEIGGWQLSDVYEKNALNDASFALSNLAG